MSYPKVERPQDSEYPTYFSPYVNFVPDVDVLEYLAQQREQTIAKFRSFTPEQLQTRLPKETDWNVYQILGHMVDVENLMLFRAITIARNPQQELFGMDQDSYANNAQSDQYSIETLIDLYDAQRRNTLAYAKVFPEHTWTQLGVTGGKRMSVRALFYIIAGHELWHLVSLRNSYKL